MQTLTQEILSCQICKEYLPLGIRPVFTAEEESKIVIIGQAPGKKVHENGIPWQDKSGDTLRRWLGVTEEEFYNPQLFALIPMGFCYPGKGKSGDLPPRPECAPQWHSKLLEKIENVKITLLIGQYAQAYYLKEKRFKTLTETVQNYQNYLPEYFPLPHPSPRNNIWMKKNEWFEESILPQLTQKITAIKNQG